MMNAAPMSPQAHESIIVHALHVCLTRFIPVPFVDDFAANQLRRQLLARLAESHHVKLDSAGVKALADDGLFDLGGCLFAILFFPIRLLFRNLALLFRLKRFADRLSRQYLAARLAEFALRNGWLSGESAVAPAALRRAIDSVCGQADVLPVQTAFLGVIKSHREIFNGIASSIHQTLRGLRGRKTSEAEMQRALESVESSTAGDTEALAAPFRKALEAVPPEYFAKLEENLVNHLREAP